MRLGVRSCCSLSITNENSRFAKRYCHTPVREAVAIVSICRRIRMSTGTTTPLFILDCFALLVSKLAHLGNRVIGLDPDFKALAIARQRCAGFGNVEIRQIGFLEAMLNDDGFSIGVSSRRTTTATWRRALHSRSPETRYARGLRMGHIPKGAFRPFVRRSEGVGK
jgi:hypothetical protein